VQIQGDLIVKGDLIIDELLEEIQMLKDMAGIGTVTDIDGNTYRTVKIGDQVWMAENLNVTRLNDGTQIKLETDGEAFWQLDEPGYCYYDNNESEYGNLYGALYNGYTVYTNHLCPAGWHVPNEEEWPTLVTYLGGSNSAVLKIREFGTTYWSWEMEGATNESGFTALPGGYRIDHGQFLSENGEAFWWSSTPHFDGTYGWLLQGGYVPKIEHNSVSNEHGLSVRCVKDSS
jgi:uncharacterized protein (TIGR02145 family)